MNASQLEILRPFITPKVKKIVKERLLHGLKFFEAGTIKKEFTRADIKLSLLLIRIANPKELLNLDEIQILEGAQRKAKNK